MADKAYLSITFFADLRHRAEFEVDCRRHIFADKLYVEEYRAADFQTELGLNRQKLIYLALLLGSDYTEGINGIGIVNAVCTCTTPMHAGWRR